MKTSNRRVGGWMAAITGAALLGGCSGHSLQQYRNDSPRLELKSFFSGTLVAHGMFQKPSGQVVNRFVARLDASWRGDTLKLDEHFDWSDGRKTRRVWTMVAEAEGRVKGWADDVADTARGQVVGNSFHWEYPLLLDVDGTVYKVWMDDWMHLVDNRLLLNRTRMTKWGWHLGDAILSIQKVDPPVVAPALPDTVVPPLRLPGGLSSRE